MTSLNTQDPSLAPAKTAVNTHTGEGFPLDSGATLIRPDPRMRRPLALIALLFWLQPALAGELSQGLSAYRHGRYQEAVAILKPLARHGDPFAQFTLGVMYDDGVGLPRNFGLALQWYKRAAAQGLADAQYMAGRFYGNGRGVKQDPAAALFWLELAAAAGHPLAPTLRDQHWNQLTSPRRDRVADEATRWQAEHPNQISCKWRRCVYPVWTARPGWTILDRDEYYP